MSTRREARERTLQALYARELSDDAPEHVLRTVVEPHLDEKAQRFAEKLFLRTLDHAETAEELIDRYVENWEVERLALVDRLLLRLAIGEFLGFPDIPPKVSINEALDIAKRYSTPRSAHFLNGVLDAVLKELVETNRLKKSGRGLVGMPTFTSS
ncbi:MAG: transcription antitermination factor NusB [Bacteroidota bacterium]